MPLYVIKGDDHRQITTDDLARILSIDKSVLAAIAKNPVFEINPKKTTPDKLNGGFIAPAGKGSKPVIYVNVDKNEVITDKVGGLRLAIRYAESIVPDRENPRISTYEPKRIRFMDLLDIEPNFELALFKYCLPACFNSPIADKRNWHYKFQDKRADAQQVNEVGQRISKALGYLNNPVESGGLTETQVLLIAKGIYAQNRNPAIIPNPSAKNKTIIEIKADLTTLILKNPEIFLNSVNDDVNEFYGMIMEAVDRGIFGIRKGNSSRGWYWEQGPQKNMHITDINPTVNDFDALKSAIEANPNAFYATINKAVKEAAGKDSVAAFMRKHKEQLGQQPNGPVSDDDFSDLGEFGDVVNKPDDTKPPAKVEPVAFKMPENYQASVELAISLNEGKRPAPKALGKFWGAIKPPANIPVEKLKSTLDAIIAEAE